MIQKNGNKEEILIVEDSPTQAEAFKFLLEKHGYSVSVASNGMEALGLINERKPTIVISDIVMPEMDGYQLCRHIKQNENLKDIPVILLTALTDTKDVLKGLECGADNFVTKPYDEKYILSRIQFVIANRLLRESEKMQMGIEIYFGNQKYFITAERQQILNLLLSTYETAVQRNLDLLKLQDDLKGLNERLEEKVIERTASLKSEIEERERAEISLRKSETKNRAILDAIPDLMFQISKDGTFLDFKASRSIELDPPPTEFLGKKVLEVLPVEIARKIMHSIEMVLQTGNMHVFEYQLLMKDVMHDYEARIVISGNDEVIAIIRDITDRKRAEETLKRRLEVEKTIASTSARFIRISDFDEAISSSLADIGSLSGASRSYLFLFREGGTMMDNTHEWCAEGVTHEIKNLQNLSTSIYPWWMTKLHAGEVIHIIDVFKLPPEAAAEKKILESQNIKSLLVLPVCAGAELIGFIGFDNIKTTGSWQDENMVLLRIASEIIGNAFHRKRIEEIIKESEENYRRIADFSPFGICIHSDYKYVYVNLAGAKILGAAKPEDLIGKTVLQFVHPDYQEIVKVRIRKEEQGEIAPLIEEKLLRLDGTPVDVEVAAIPFTYKGKLSMYGVFQEITERKRAEEEINNSLREKEVLLREIHHRVKNNMQIISSLLKLQTEHIDEEKYRYMLKECQNRIASMSLIHEKLYRSKDLAVIDLNEYIRDLATNLFQSYGIGRSAVTLNVDVEKVNLGIDLATPCGLIINELVTNSLKHAFPDGRKGEIKIALKRNNENTFELIVNDDGIGIPEDLDFRKVKSLGLSLVTMLVEDQLEGEISLDRSRGTEFQIKFKGEN